MFGHSSVRRSVRLFPGRETVVWAVNDEKLSQTRCKQCCQSRLTNDHRNKASDADECNCVIKYSQSVSDQVQIFHIGDEHGGDEKAESNPNLNSLSKQDECCLVEAEFTCLISEDSYRCHCGDTVTTEPTCRQVRRNTQSECLGTGTDDLSTECDPPTFLSDAETLDQGTDTIEESTC